MDWKECVNRRIVKDVEEDSNLIKSTRQIANMKIKSADVLTQDLYYGKISLLYDALRSYLECIALEKGYKIYNHECYSSFLKEIMDLSTEAEEFDKLRKIRNGINYYGREFSQEEANEIVKYLKSMIDKFRK